MSTRRINDPFKNMLSSEIFEDDDKLYSAKFHALKKYLQLEITHLHEESLAYPEQLELFRADVNKLPMALLYPFEKGFLLTRIYELIFRQNISVQIIHDVLNEEKDDFIRKVTCRDFSKIVNDRTSLVLYSIINEMQWEPGCGFGDKIIECLLSMDLSYHFKYPDLG